MKWREKRHGEMWFTGPEEGRVVHFARKGGVTYEVQATWHDPWKREGRIVWRLAGVGADFKSREAAQTEAERRAAGASRPKGD